MSDRPAAIQSLKLDEAFSAGTNMPFDECWTVRTDSRLFIIDDDDEKYSRFSDDESDRYRALAVINESNKEVYLLSIDNRLIANYPGGIADCALFDNSRFCFVEFKTNAYGNSRKAVEDTFVKATEQLKNTIKLFDRRICSVGADFADLVAVNCHVVVSESFPKSKAAKQQFQLEFADATGYELHFDSKLFW